MEGERSTGKLLQVVKEAATVQLEHQASLAFLLTVPQRPAHVRALSHRCSKKCVLPRRLSIFSSGADVIKLLHSHIAHPARHAQCAFINATSTTYT